LAYSPFSAFEFSGGRGGVLEACDELLDVIEAVVQYGDVSLVLLAGRGAGLVVERDGGGVAGGVGAGAGADAGARVQVAARALVGAAHAHAAAGLLVRRRVEHRHLLAHVYPVVGGLRGRRRRRRGDVPGAPVHRGFAAT